MEQVDFLVEQAGCASCAARVKSALEHLLDISEVTIDEDADVATVTGHARPGLRAESVDAALTEASHGSGHTYSIRPGSWHAAPAVPRQPGARRG